MGLTKTKDYTKDQIRLAEVAKAMGHPARIAILEYLVRENKCQCGDIVDELPLSQSTTSQHLKELKNAGLIHGDIEGVKVCYCINPKVWNEVKTLLNKFLNKYQDCC